MAKLKPLAGYVLVESLDEAETTASGLVMPDKAKEKPSKGKVVAVGGPIIHYLAGVFQDKNGNFTPQEHCPVNIGDIVQHHRWAGQDIKEGQKEYRLVQFKDLMAVYV